MKVRGAECGRGRIRWFRGSAAAPAGGAVVVASRNPLRTTGKRRRAAALHDAGARAKRQERSRGRRRRGPSCQWSSRFQVFFREAPRFAIRGHGPLGGFPIAHDLLLRRIEPEAASQFEREQAEHDGHIHAGVVKDVATRLLTGLDAVEPFMFVAG